MYPKQVQPFKEWATAMVAGATVDRPKLKRLKAARRRRQKSVKGRKRRSRLSKKAD